MDLLVKLLGWKSTILHGDPCVYDRWRWITRHLQRGPLRTLDAGCGSGAFSLYAATVGNECVGVSFQENEVMKARRRAALLGLSVTFIQADLRQLDGFEWSPFDQIICTETIEHIQDDRKLIRDFARLLKPGGRLILSTPFELCNPLLGDRISDHEDGGHVRPGYTHQQLRRLFDENDICTKSEEYVSGVVTQELTNLMRMLGRINGRLAWCLTLPFRALGVLDRPLTALARHPYLSLAVVGVKRLPDNGEKRG